MRGDERLARRGLAPGAIASCFRCLLWLSSHIDIACSDRAFAFSSQRERRRALAADGRDWESLQRCGPPRAGPPRRYRRRRFAGPAPPAGARPALIVARANKANPSMADAPGGRGRRQDEELSLTELCVRQIDARSCQRGCGRTRFGPWVVSQGAIYVQFGRGDLGRGDSDVSVCLLSGESRRAGSRANCGWDWQAWKRSGAML